MEGLTSLRLKTKVANQLPRYHRYCIGMCQNTITHGLIIHLFNTVIYTHRSFTQQSFRPNIDKYRIICDYPRDLDDPSLIDFFWQVSKKLKDSWSRPHHWPDGKIGSLICPRATSPYCLPVSLTCAVDISCVAKHKTNRHPFWCLVMVHVGEGEQYLSFLIQFAGNKGGLHDCQSFLFVLYWTHNRIYHYQLSPRTYWFQLKN